MRVYVCPALVDWLFFFVAFAVSYGAGKRGMTVNQLAWIGGLCQLAYMGGSLVSGSFLSRRNALPIVIASTAGATIMGVFCVAATNFWPLIIAMTLLGLCMAFFFNSFQSFMRGESAPGELARTTALYTLAWSSGSGLGMLTCGALFQLGPVALALVIVLAGGVILATMLLHKARSHDEPSADEHTEHGPEGAAPVAPIYVWTGWMLIFTAIFVQRPLMTYYPKFAAERNIAAVLAGLPLFLHCLLQGIGGFYVGRLRRWLYRPAIVAIQLTAGAGFIVLWQFPCYAVTAVGIAAMGLWTGFAYYCAVYYASNDGHRARNIGINEFLVGAGSFASLFVSDWFMTRTGETSVMYAVCAGALFLSTAAQWATIRLAKSAPSGR